MLQLFLSHFSVSDYMIGENIQVSLADVAMTTNTIGSGGGSGSVGVGGVNRGKSLGLAQKGSLGFSKVCANKVPNIIRFHQFFCSFFSHMTIWQCSVVT